MDAQSPTPFDELKSRHELRWGLAQYYARQARRVIVLKRVYLASFIGYAVFDPTVAAVLLPVAISMIPIVALQQFLVTRWALNRRSADYYASALARLSGRWSDWGDQGDRYSQADHPYAIDLDLFGRSSLFQLLCRPCTTQGRDVLAGWLTKPADAPEILRRQEAVRELVPLLDVREAFHAVGGQNLPTDTATLEAAADAPPVFATKRVKTTAFIAAWLWLVTAVLAVDLGGTWPTVFALGLVVQIVAYVACRQRVRVICSRGYQIGQSLVAASNFASLINSRRWQCHLLKQQLAIVNQAPRPLPRRVAAAIGVLAQLPLAYFVLVQLIPLFELRLLRRLRHLPRFWQAVGQCETLVALATHAYEHPNDCFPEITEAAPCLVAQQLGHPLITDADSVRNDVRLDGHPQILMVSGSNMSGKSTLLRTVGVNAALGLAGATVRARSMRLSPLVIGAAMRFQDSLEEGTSYFYSVLSRLRRVLDLLQDERPLLFLLDEIMQGTNSHDRLVGAEAVIRKLLAADAIGLVTTHDLELTHIAEHLGPAVANVHFVDTVVAGRLQFDYRMRDGVVQSSNAIQLMRDMGLDV